MWEIMKKKGTLIHWECKWAKPLGNQYGGFCQKTTIWPSNSTSGHISERNETTNSKEYMYPNVQILLFKNAKILK